MMEDTMPVMQRALLFLQSHTLQDISGGFLSGDEIEGFFVLAFDTVVLTPSSERILKSVDIFHVETQTTISLGIRYNND